MMFKVRKFSAIILFSILSMATLLSACSLNVRSLEDTRFALDTLCTVTLYGTSEKETIDDCFKLIEDYENLLSKTREGSDVYKINHSAGETVEVSSETIHIINRCKFYWELTDGKFDITVGRLTSLWNFTGEVNSVPDSAQIKEAVATVGFENIIISGNTVTLQNKNTQIDLGAAAKGYIADKLAEFLQSKGISSALINLGGNVYALGSKPDGTPFSVGISKPFGDASEVIGSVEVSSGSVVTSGISQRYFYDEDGTLYHHILDAHSGMPFNSLFASVSIISGSSFEADLLSTSIFLMGDSGIEYLNKSSAAQAVAVKSDGSIVTTDNIKTYGFEER